MQIHLFVLLALVVPICAVSLSANQALGLGPALCDRCPQYFGLGNQKAGTTLTGEVLAHALDVTFENDCRKAWAPSKYFKGLKGHYDMAAMTQLCNMLPKPRKGLTKEGHLTLFFPEIHTMCPNTHFYFTIRHPVNNIVSIMDRLKLKPADLMKHPKQLKLDKVGWRDVVDMSYAGVHEPNILSALTTRWNLIARTYLDAPKGLITLVRFEDLESSDTRKSAVSKATIALNSSAAINMESALLQFNNHEQPTGSHHSVDRRAFLGDSLYDTIVKQCSENMKAFGYA